MSQIMPVWGEFLAIALAHGFAVASPGPDYALIVRNSARYGRASALVTSGGIATGILFHTTLAISGISVLLLGSPLLSHLMRYVAAAYLLYLGVMALRARPASRRDDEIASSSEQTIPPLSAFFQGLLTNGLNPKALLFFVTVFMVAQQAPLVRKAVYGLYMAVATWAWFSAMSLLLTRARVRRWMTRCGHYLDWATGIILVGLAVTLVLLP